MERPTPFTPSPIKGVTLGKFVVFGFLAAIAFVLVAAVFGLMTAIVAVLALLVLFLMFG